MIKCYKHFLLLDLNWTGIEETCLRMVFQFSFQNLGLYLRIYLYLCPFEIACGIFRLLRRKVVLAIIFTLSLSYCIISFISVPTDIDVNDSYILPARKLRDTFLWHSNEEFNGTVKVTTCRNSVQGMDYIVDDRGYLCNRTNELLANGCCDSSLQNIERYSCEKCKENGCCEFYEYCISCCLHPNKKDLLQNVLGKAPETFRVLFSSVTDHFELCLAKCRTNSRSVEHENSYKDPESKYCYGESPS